MFQDIKTRYDAEHDTGPNAPVPWYVMALILQIERQEKRIAELEEKLAQSGA